MVSDATQRTIVRGCLIAGVGCAGVCSATLVAGCGFLWWLLPDPPPPITDDRRDELVQRLLVEHNARRDRPLVRSPPLERAAQRHAEHMAEFEYVGHEDRRNGETVGARARRAGYRGIVGENCAGEYDDVRTLMEDWMASPEGHGDNIVDPQWKHVGFGIAIKDLGVRRAVYWCVVFGNGHEVDE